MLQVFQNPKTGKTTVEDITPPILRSGGVLVRNHFSLISAGTERGIIEISKKGLLAKAKERPDYVQKFFMLLKTKGITAAWRVAQSKLESDIALGYSSAGEVIAVGDGVEYLRVGDRVAAAGQDYASHAEIIYVPKNLCVRIPKGVSEEEAAFATLGAIAMQGIRQANLLPGERVGVVGLGLLGQLASRLLRGYGHPVVGFDVNPLQVEFARKNGLEEGIVLGKEDYKTKVEKFTNRQGVDAVLIYASAKTDDPLRLAVEISRDRGRIVQVGNILTNIPWRDFYKKELSYYSSRSYGPGRYDKNYEEKGEDYPLGYVRWTEKRNMEEFLRLLAQRRIDIKDLITRTFDIKEAESAYELVFGPRGLIHGLLLRYPQKGGVATVIHPPKAKEAAKAPALEAGAVVSIGLIGLGAFMNSTILPHLKELRGVKIKGVSHSRGLSAKKTGMSWGADYVTSDYKKIIEDKNIDLVICATRHASHAKIAKEALAANKNIYIEKPLALNEKELREVIDVAQKSKGRLLVGFNRRFSYHFIAARKEFSNSPTPLQILYRINVGPLEKDHWSYEPGEGGRIVGEGCHFVDALQFLTGSLPQKLWTSAIPAGGAVSHEENFTVNIEYRNGSIGVVIYSALGNFRLPKEYLEIYGNEKIMVIDNFKKGKVIYPNRTQKLNLWHQDKGYGRELEVFLEAIREGKPSPLSLDDIFVSHLTTFKAMESLKTGKVIELNNA